MIPMTALRTFFFLAHPLPFFTIKAFLLVSIQMGYIKEIVYSNEFCGTYFNKIKLQAYLFWGVSVNERKSFRGGS